MFTCANISAGQASTYYKLDDYYLEKASVPVRVMGAAAERLGLAGEFDSAKFNASLRGTYPIGDIGQANRPSLKRAGFDCVFSAPKSVSIEALVNGNQAVVDVHQDAVDAAMKEVEALILARVTSQFVTSNVAAHIAYFNFRHETSRTVPGQLPDPNLHDHNVILKQVMVRGEDGVEKLYALNNREIMRAQKMLDAVYKQHLATGLRRLGYSLLITRDGFELEGFSKSCLDLFSKRRLQVDANLHDRNIDRSTATAKQREAAALKDRQSKRTFSRAEMREGWRLQLASTFSEEVQSERDATSKFEDSRKTLPFAVQTASPSTGESQMLHLLSGAEVVAAALNHFGQRQAVIASRYQLVEFSIRAAEFSVSKAEIENEIETCLTDGRLILGRNGSALVIAAALEDEQALDAAYLGGKSVVDPISTADVAHDAIKLLEHSLAARRRAEAERTLGRPLFANEADALSGKLTEGQRQMIFRIAGSQDRFNVFVGDAGTGKSTALEAAKDLLVASGYKVFGLAPSGASVDALREALDNNRSLDVAEIETTTVQHAFHNPKYWEKVDTKSVIILDEAGLVDIKTMLHVMKNVADRGARLQIVGDPKQFSSVDRGTAMRQLCDQAERNEALISLTEMRRWKNETMKEMHFAARDNPEAALDHLFKNRMVTTVADEDTRLTKIAELYERIDLRDRKSALVLAGTNDERIKINAAIRERLGLGPGVAVSAIEFADKTEEQTQMLESYEIGDVIRLNKQFGQYRTGSMLAVTDKGGGSIVLRDRNGLESTLHPIDFGRSVSIGKIETINLAVGDRVRITAADKTKGLLNGDKGEVVGIESGQLRIRLDRTGNEMELSVGENDPPIGLRLGYCQTGHSAQGATAKMTVANDHERPNVILAINAADATVDWKSWYTNITRAADSMHVVTNATTAREIEVMRGKISRSREKQTANDAIFGGGENSQRTERRNAYIAPATGADSWRRIAISSDPSEAEVLATLKQALSQYGREVFVAGSREEQRHIARLAGKHNVDVRFDSTELESVRNRNSRKNIFLAELPDNRSMPKQFNFDSDGSSRKITIAFEELPRERRMHVVDVGRDVLIVRAQGKGTQTNVYPTEYSVVVTDHVRKVVRDNKLEKGASFTLTTNPDAPKEVRKATTGMKVRGIY